MSHGHGHGASHDHTDPSSKRIAIFITVIGLMLAIVETMAKGAQTNSIASNVEASNLWSFFQAKTIRQTTLRTAAEQMDIDVQLAKDPATRQILEKRVATWKQTADRYQNEGNDESGEGRDQLAKRAKKAETKRDVYMDRYHCYEIGSAAFQIAIVMASVYLLTHISMLLWAAAGLCGLGVTFAAIGFVAPHLIHNLMPH
jgi:Domain of unknown function (DUF4337)